jgi:hypothetical protein
MSAMAPKAVPLFAIEPICAAFVLLKIAQRFNAGTSMVRKTKSRQGRKKRVLSAGFLSSLCGTLFLWIAKTQR